MRALFYMVTLENVVEGVPALELQRLIQSAVTNALRQRYPSEQPRDKLIRVGVLWADEKEDA